MNSLRFFAVLVTVWLTLGTNARLARADEAMDRARSHYEMGIALFEARQPEQALLEFQRANELKSRPAAVFMMAQCEYLIGQLKEARTHYEQYVRQSPEGEFVELAKDRILAIERRPGVLVVNSVPDQVDIRITPANGGAALASGQAPNNFSVPRGKYRVTASKNNFQSETRVLELDLAETKPIFFKLEPIPARLEIWTDPPNATLYVNGNRARNPFLQDVAPGKYEIYAESPDYYSRAAELTVGPGQKKSYDQERSPFRLRYIQRSGRPELVGASALAGGLLGMGSVFVMMNPNFDVNDQGPGFPVTPLIGGAVSGAVAGGLIANAVLPSYIPDNRALWIIGGMLFGGSEGVGLGLIIDSKTGWPALGGSVLGLAAGTATAALLAPKAPNYGRVAMLESAAVGGALAGALIAVPLNSAASKTVSGQGTVNDNRYMVVKYALPMVIGMNLGLGAGLAAAYLPDQKQYGPSWQRILLIDLAAVAGSVVGLTAAALANDSCINPSEGQKRYCPFDFPNDTKRAMFTLGGGVMGLVAGTLMTRTYDRDRDRRDLGGTAVSMSRWMLPVPAMLPVDTGHGMATAPGLMTAGSF